MFKPFILSLPDGSFLAVNPVRPRFAVGGATEKEALEKAGRAFDFAIHSVPNNQKL